MAVYDLLWSVAEAVQDAILNMAELCTVMDYQECTNTRIRALKVSCIHVELLWAVNHGSFCCLLREC